MIIQICEKRFKALLIVKGNKMKKLLIVCSLLALLTGCTNNSANGIQEQTVQVQAQENLIAGSGSNLVITCQLLEAYEKNSGKHIELPESIGSGGAIMAIKSG